MKRIIAAALSAVLLLALSACQTNYAGSAYDPEFVRAGFTVAYGELLGIGKATIEGEAGLAGGIGGGVVGGALGSTIGGGSGQTVATAVGAVGGAIAGSAIQKKMGTQDAFEFEVKLDDGRIISVVQTTGDDVFHVGDRVRVLTANGGQYAGQMRIRPLLSAAE